MAKEFSKKFYESKQWIDTRNSYASSKNYICEVCGKPGEIVHHKIWLNAINVHDPNITLNQDNLLLVCRSCHKQIHDNMSVTPIGIHFTSDGDII